LGLLILSRVVPLPAFALQAGFVAIMLLVIAWVVVQAGGHRIDFRVRNWTGSLLLGVGVFALWIAPDRLFPGYRHFWLFENPVMGRLETSLPAAARAQTAVLWLRGFRAVAIVPIVEELFWRAWLMRWLIAADFESLPLGTWSARAFWIVAVLFASEHGPYWDVGLAAGVLYNWWMLRSRSLGDLVAAHAVTNACLSAYVVWSGRWEYWL
jgi:CAAX prenyl protease-like protein